jgi:hypothetical protein
MSLAAVVVDAVALGEEMVEAVDVGPGAGSSPPEHPPITRQAPARPTPHVRLDRRTHPPGG